VNWTILLMGIIGILLSGLCGWLGYQAGHAKGLAAPTFRKVVAVPADESAAHPTIRSADIRRATAANWGRISGPGNLREED
jgi:hypothetical protein